MKAQTVIKKIYKNNLVEIIDRNRMRIFYGKMSEMNKVEWWYIKGKNVSEINCFLAQTSESSWEPAIQMTLSE